MLTLIPLQLYTTSYCHLCEQAEVLLAKHQNINLKLIEISDNETLMTLYGTRIPVLQRRDNGTELNWPFNQHDIHTFINA